MSKFIFLFLLIAIHSIPALAQIYKYDSLGIIKEIKYANGTSVYLQKDPNGNRIRNSFTASTICSGTNASFQAELFNPANNYQWQVDTGTGFINIINDVIYSGATSNLLTLKSPPTFWYGNTYRCSISGAGGPSVSNSDTLKFVAVWYGGHDTAWENSANWGCNKLPDEYTDVIVYSNVLNHPVISSNQSVRSFTGNPKARLIVTSGNNFYIAIPN